jgi:hypothetical protein
MNKIPVSWIRVAAGRLGYLPEATRSFTLTALRENEIRVITPSNQCYGKMNNMENF